jgi:hypothetical protein
MKRKSYKFPLASVLYCISLLWGCEALESWSSLALRNALLLESMIARLCYYAGTPSTRLLEEVERVGRIVTVVVLSDATAPLLLHSRHIGVA